MKPYYQILHVYENYNANPIWKEIALAKENAETAWLNIGKYFSDRWRHSSCCENETVITSKAKM